MKAIDDQMLLSRASSSLRLVSSRRWQPHCIRRCSDYAKRRAKQPVKTEQPEEPEPDWLLALKIAGGLAVTAISLRLAGPTLAKAALTVPLLLPRTAIALGPPAASAAAYVVLRRRLGWSLSASLFTAASPSIAAAAIIVKHDCDAASEKKLLVSTLDRVYAAHASSSRSGESSSSSSEHRPTVNWTHATRMGPPSATVVTARVSSWPHRHELNDGTLTITAERSFVPSFGEWRATSARVVLDHYPTEDITMLRVAAADG